MVTEQGYQGEDAAELVSVDYDPLPAVVDLDDALAGDTLLFDGTDSNVIRTGGEPAPPGTFDGCEVVVRRTFPNQRVAPLPLEGRAAAARWADGRLTLWASTQNAQLARDALAAAVGLDAAAVRVVAPDVGGGFGAKIAVDRDTIIVAWAAKHLGRPVRWVETRNENLLGMVHGRAQRHTITIGGSRDGRILAYHLDIVQDSGAYPRGATFLPGLTQLMASGVYDLAYCGSAFRSVLTNTTPIGAYRGAGRPEATAAIERAVDLFAAEIGMDPAEVRRRNVVAPEAFPYTTASGAVYDTGDYAAALDAVLSGAGYAGLRAEQAQRRARRPGGPVQLGIGLASYVEITAGDTRGRDVPGGGGRHRRGDGVHRQLAARPGPRDRVRDAGHRPARHPDGPDHRDPRGHRSGAARGRDLRLPVTAARRHRGPSGHAPGEGPGPRGGRGHDRGQRRRPGTGHRHAAPGRSAATRTPR